MEWIMNYELFDKVDEMELIEFGVPRAIYNRADHFNNMPDYTFFKIFRLTKETTMFLLPFLENQLEFAADTNNCITPMNQLLTCLRYFATGAHLDIIADFMGMHQTTVIRIVPKVSRAIASLYKRFINFPSTVDEQGIVKDGFYQIARFPNVIGAIDCTHIKIKSPGGDDPEIYRNRKDYFSINVQAICDANNRFLNVVARWPGASHDSTIFNNSNVKTLFEHGRLPNCVILDRGYACQNYLLTPLANPNTPAERLYNQSHIRTRNKIECSFGILKRRFPVLAYGCRLQLDSTLVVIVAAMILHNLAKLQNEEDPGIEEDMDPRELDRLIEDGQIPIMNYGDDGNVRGFDYRNLLIQQYFSRL